VVSSQPPGRPAATRRSAFFPLGRAEGWTLVLLVAYSALGFLPPWQSVEIAGMALFGWWMAALMVLSPALTLFVFLRRRKSGR
jgi:hypothetical protein